MSLVRERVRVWVGARSVAEVKSRESLLMKSLRVRGAEGESEERTRIEWSFRAPAKLVSGDGLA